MEYIISNITKAEVSILNDAGVDYYPDSMWGDDNDVTFDDREEYIKALELLGRR